MSVAYSYGTQIIKCIPHDLSWRIGHLCRARHINTRYHQQVTNMYLQRWKYMSPEAHIGSWDTIQYSSMDSNSGYSLEKIWEWPGNAWSASISTLLPDRMWCSTRIVKPLWRNMKSANTTQTLKMAHPQLRAYKNGLHEWLYDIGVSNSHPRRIELLTPSAGKENRRRHQ